VEGTVEIFDFFLHDVLGEALVDVKGTGRLIMETYSFLGVGIEMC
jgi:hypothetical protein